MTTKQVIMQSHRVTTEGDELYYEVRGQGQPLLMIPVVPGMGNIMQPSEIFCLMNTKSLPTTAVPMPVVR